MQNRALRIKPIERNRGPSRYVYEPLCVLNGSSGRRTKNGLRITREQEMFGGLHESLPRRLIEKIRPIFWSRRV